MIVIFRKKLSFTAVAIIIVIFLFNSKIVLNGARTGLLLWFETVIPTLLPFTILSSILLGLHMEDFIAKYFSPITKPLFGISPAGNYVLCIGLFCGYPLGAKTAADLVREGRLSVSEGQYLMNFCNNLSPAFIISFVCGTLLNNSKIIPATLAILYGVPIVLGIISKRFYKNEFKNEQLSLSTTEISGNNRFSKTELLDHAVTGSAETMLKLGGYIILFSIFSSLIESCTLLPDTLRLIMAALSEVSNGCSIISNSTYISDNMLLPLLMSTITFGGIAGIAQTAGMLNGTQLSLKQYIIFRLIASLTVFIITYILF